MSNLKRIGIFGGTFDPLHNGHLGAIGYALEHAGLDQLRVVVAGDPYQKKNLRTPSDIRLAWTKEAIQDYYGHRNDVVVDDSEILRSGPTYTIDTIEEIRSSHPDSSIVLIVGDDIPETIHSWHRSEELVRIVELFVVPRSIIQVSSTQIRGLIAEKKPITGLLPEKIEREILEKALYNKTTQIEE